jgi:hypothetical protein
MEQTTGGWLSNNIKPICALIIIIGVMGYLFMVTLLSVDNTVRSQALISVVTLGTAVVSYYYGYSQGAAKKDEAQATLTANSQISTTTTSVAPIATPNEPTA